MSIYKRGQTWWIQFTAPDGRRIQRSARTQIKHKAQELHDRLKAEAWRIKELGARPRHTWQEAVARWLTEQAHKKSIEDDKRLLRWLHNHLFDIYLDDINTDMIATIIFERQKTGVSNATVNRTLSVLRSILNRAVKEWGWLNAAPFIKTLPEPKIRVRWLTQREAAILLSELPPHLSAMARFTLLTGLRESNVTGLQWSQIDMPRKCAWIHPDQSKSGKALAVPLNDEAIAIIREQLGKHEKNVFTYKGQPVGSCNNSAWRKALKRAKIEDFRWHDLRHTWASWHVQNGTPLHVLQELGGWSCFDMVKRYAHLSSEHLSEYADNAKTVTNLLQFKKEEG